MKKWRNFLLALCPFVTGPTSVKTHWNHLHRAPAFSPYCTSHERNAPHRRYPALWTDSFNWLVLLLFWPHVWPNVCVCVTVSQINVRQEVFEPAGGDPVLTELLSEAAAGAADAAAAAAAETPRGRVTLTRPQLGPPLSPKIRPEIFSRQWNLKIIL